MITVTEADQLISTHIGDFTPVELPLTEAYGHVLHENILTDRDLPPFDKSLMDGIAINAESYLKGSRTFSILGTQAAGADPVKLNNHNSCYEIMTGASVPIGCDCIIPVERIVITDNKAIVEDDCDIESGKFIRKQAADYSKETLILTKGTILKSSQIALCAAVGKNKVLVNPKLKVAIVSNGDELVDIGDPIKPFQIRTSNSYYLKSSLEKTYCLKTEMYHFPDNKEILTKELKRLIEFYDVLVLTGGVSMGKFDFIPEVLKSLDVSVVFHKVKQKPGKPLWFGTTKSKKPVFALPGNPISTYVGCARYVIPQLKNKLGYRKESLAGVLTEKVSFDSSLTHYVPVTVNNLNLSPAKFTGSEDFASIAKTDGFIEFPENIKTIKKGSSVVYYEW
ncbi:MAG: molybdopterin molybdotransferase [Lysobacterales bacterium]|jgi:molybdopterin molybdotransferase